MILIRNVESAMQSICTMIMTQLAVFASQYLMLTQLKLTAHFITE